MRMTTNLNLPFNLTLPPQIVYDVESFISSLVTVCGPAKKPAADDSDRVIESHAVPKPFSNPAFPPATVHLT